MLHVLWAGNMFGRFKVHRVLNGRFGGLNRMWVFVVFDFWEDLGGG